MYWCLPNRVAINAFALLFSIAVVSAPVIRKSAVTAQTPAVVEQDEWRRTIDGWERTDSWPRDQKPLPAATRLHPGLLASIQLLVSIGSLLAFSRLDVLRTQSTLGSNGIDCLPDDAAKNS